ncbi:MAG: HAMP domain-containing histidine kinase [Bacteroidales bacterium]|nr:HAMP domain-containing histidine kinase [Bacteroidales bacterium]
MNRKVIIFIIGLMTIALLALVAVQVYWINNAMTVRQANFVRSVNEAVDGVTLRIEKRLSYNLLDSLLKDELHKKSISANFQFGVFSTRRGQMLMRTEGSDPVTLLDKGYAFTLFPGDIVREPDYLMLYFPNEKGFLIKQMAGLLAISISLILIIIFSFTYTVLTIYRQKRLSEMKSDFINNMTHEFKTPISTISLACQALKDNDVSKSEAIYDSYIGIIGEENLRLGAMAEKILQSAVLDKKQLELTKEWFDIHEVITDVVNKIGIQVQIKDGKITTNFRADPSEIYADRVHITNLVNNLLDNANKFTPQKPLIRVSTENVGTGIMISIEDNGIGIGKKNQKKIFDKLFRVPMGDLHDFKGFGLGLSYVKAIVEYHKGSISLESEIKKGTKFDVFLPYES